LILLPSLNKSPLAIPPTSRHGIFLSVFVATLSLKIAGRKSMVILPLSGPTSPVPVAPNITSDPPWPEPRPPIYGFDHTPPKEVALLLFLLRPRARLDSNDVEALFYRAIRFRRLFPSQVGSYARAKHLTFALFPSSRRLLNPL